MPSLTKALILSAALLALADARAATDESAPKHDSSSASETLQEVTVTAEQAKLVSRVRAFVGQIAAPDETSGDGLPLWHVPVCPSVTGLTRQQGEYLLWRISEIARGAGVPLAGEKCRPNLFIFVTARPKQLLEAMDKRRFAVTFRDSSPLTVDQFIATAEPVRIWYLSHELTAEYAEPNYNLSAKFPCPSASIDFQGGAHLPGRVICDSERSSHVTNGSALVPVFSDVYVIVDATRLQGVAWPQLADYLGMVGLAKINPTARLGDAPTILRLFDGSREAAPSGVTDWDRAFLKSLYATEQRLKTQREQVANAMVRELVH